MSARLNLLICSKSQSHTKKNCVEKNDTITCRSRGEMFHHTKLRMNKHFYFRESVVYEGIVQSISRHLKSEKIKSDRLHYTARGWLLECFKIFFFPNL